VGKRKGVSTEKEQDNQRDREREQERNTTRERETERETHKERGRREGERKKEGERVMSLFCGHCGQSIHPSNPMPNPTPFDHIHPGP